MSLTSALNIAQNSLLNTQRQVSVVSRNIADASNPDYSRRTATLSSLAPGSRIVDVRRATNEALFRQSLTALSGYSAQHKIADGLDRLMLGVNGVDNASSPASALGGFQRALELYAATPSNTTLAQNAVEAARSLVRSLNQGTQTVQAFRSDMDSQIAGQVTELNVLLSDFKSTNDEVITGTIIGRDINDALDKRDALLKRIAEFVPITAIPRQNGDLMIVTGDGTTLFETVPRTVSFQPTAAYAPGMTGNGIRIDGMPVNGGVGGNTTASGSLSALLQLRDTASTGIQLQLDEMAAALNDAVPGLLVFTGAATDPGLAGRISLNPLLDPFQGGNPKLLRDGIPNENLGNDASFSDVLNRHIAALDEPRTFVTANGTSSTFSLMDYSTDAIGWLEASRQEAAGASESKNALIMRATAALSNETNVNIDEEMALLLELEHSYSASARILQTIDTLLATLLDAAR
jgi:flagellar hook-associated protein 1 FlgK